MSYENLMKIIKMTRSIRPFKPDPIPEEYVDKILEASRWAPSGFNSQPWALKPWRPMNWSIAPVFIIMFGFF